MESLYVKKNIGKNINTIRLQKNMTNPQFAKYIKTTPSQLSNVIKGERGFSITKLLEISEITGYPIEFILTGKKSHVEEDLKHKLSILQKEIKQIHDETNHITSILN